jgi:hypothetical protein
MKTGSNLSELLPGYTTYQKTVHYQNLFPAYVYFSPFTEPKVHYHIHKGCPLVQATSVPSGLPVPVNSTYTPLILLLWCSINLTYKKLIAFKILNLMPISCCLGYSTQVMGPCVIFNNMLHSSGGGVVSPLPHPKIGGTLFDSLFHTAAATSTPV